ncbi:hypothetical protein PUN28_016844 [Cardiocondyla obscurior]|uniref:Uncharacterized protein n=1 Tax=Cardiocondyla obscurior TaxID=286306 RepID=A0AAW2ERD5_9HYME
MKFKYSMHNGYISTLDFKNYNLTDSHWLILIIGEKEQVASVKCRLHTATFSREHLTWRLLIRLTSSNIDCSMMKNWPRADFVSREYYFQSLCKLFYFNLLYLYLTVLCFILF